MMQAHASINFELVTISYFYFSSLRVWNLFQGICKIYAFRCNTVLSIYSRSPLKEQGLREGILLGDLFTTVQI